MQYMGAMLILKVYSPYGISEEFYIVVGVLQGDIISPYLFIIVLEYVLRKESTDVKRN